MSARDDILAALRVGAANRRASASASDPVLPARATGDAIALRDRFVEMARFAGASVGSAVAAGIPAAISAYLSKERLGDRVVLAPEPALISLPWRSAPRLEVRTGVPGPEDRVSVTAAIAGAAETGSLLVSSGSRTANAAHVLCETHIAVLPAGDIVGGYEAALSRLRGDGGAMPRAATFITGPSRTADIEKTPQIGVHGPKRLHILLVDE